MFYPNRSPGHINSDLETLHYNHDYIHYYQRTLTFLIIPIISTSIPDQPINGSTIPIPRNMQLADPAFNLPAPIDILLSSEPTVASLWVGQINLNPATGRELRLQKTRFEWVIGGRPGSPSTTSVFHASTADLEMDLTRFWELDE
jgi:hypothetical protein